MAPLRDDVWQILMTTSDNKQFAPKLLGDDIHWLSFLMLGHAAFQYLHAGCELGVFDLLEQSPCLPAKAIEEALGLESHPTRGLLLGLASLGLLNRSNGGFVLCGAVSALFHSGHWAAFKDTIRFEAQIVYPGQLDFVEALRRNTNYGLRQIPGNGDDLYHKLSSDPALQRTFYDYMGSWSGLIIDQLIRAIDFSRFHRILDVGGGDAGNAIAIAKANPHLEVAILELPGNSELARSAIKDAKLESRISIIEGDMFAELLPQAFDCILFIHQLVIWPPTKIAVLLARAHASLLDGGTVVICSSMSDDSEDGPVFSAMDSAYFLCIPAVGGLIYPWCDYERWLVGSGFKDIQRHTLDTWTPHGVLTARKSL